MARIMFREVPDEIIGWLSQHTRVEQGADLALTGNLMLIAKLKEECPVVFISGRVDEDSVKAAYMLGVAECISMPNTCTQVQKRVEHLLSYQLATKCSVESEKRYRAALNAIPDMIIHFKEDGTVLDAYFDDGFPAVFDPRLAIGKRLGDVYKHPLCTTFEEQVKRCIQINETIEITYELKGKCREARIVPINHGMREALILIRDVTSIKQMSAELAGLRSVPSKFDTILSLSEEVFQRATRATRVRKAEYAS